MASLFGKLQGRVLTYGFIGLLGLIVAYLFFDRFVFNAARPPFAGAEVDPAALDSPLEEPPQASEVIAPPPPGNGETEPVR